MNKTQQSSTLLLFFFCGGLLLLGQETLPTHDSINSYASQVIFALLLGTVASLGLRWKRPFLSLAVGATVLAIVCGRGNDLFLIREPLTALWPFLLCLLAHLLTDRCVKQYWFRFGLCYAVYFLITLGGGYLLLLHTRPWLCFEPIRAVWLVLSADAALWAVNLKEDYVNRICKLVPMAVRNEESDLLRQTISMLSLREYRLRRMRILWTVISNLAALAFLLTQGRIQDILCDGVGSWLSWRYQMLVSGLSGNLTAVGPLFQDAVVHHCPLSRIHSVYGLGPFLLALLFLVLIFMLMLLILRRMPDQRIYKPICRGLFLCLLIKTLLTLAADLFLIHSAQVQVMFLSTPWDLVTLTIFLVLASCPDRRSAFASMAEQKVPF